MVTCRDLLHLRDDRFFADMDFIGQLQPHAAARLVAVDMPGAPAARHERRAVLAEGCAQPG